MEVKVINEEKVQTMTNTEKAGTESLVSETVAILKGIPTKEQLMEMLRKEVVEVTFLKLDGEERVMPCTLHPGIVPAPEVKEGDTVRTKKQNDKVLAVWALEAKAFRSFRYDRVKSVKIVPYGNGTLDGANY
jgi:hypothetical protein